MRRTLKSRFRLRSRIGKGSFGLVYSGEDATTGREIAIKMNSDPLHSYLHEREVEVYRTVSGAVGFPTMYDCGTDNDSEFIVMDLLGKSIKAIFRERGKKFSLKTTLMLIDQMLCRVEFLHNCGIIHRDLKPSNFCSGGVRMRTKYV